MTQIKRIAVIGAGTMGRQISLQIAIRGFRVALYDIDSEVLTAAEQAQRDIVADWIVAGRAPPDTLDKIIKNLRYCADLSEACRDADLAIEAVPERLDVKRAVFARLDRLLPPGATIASNSSSIRVSRLEGATERPQRVANLHFYLPVWDSPMAEVGGGARTQPAVLEALADFARAIGILPLRVRRESTGFVFNRVWRAVKKEVMRVADSGVASIEDIDRAWMIKFGREKPPPFAQMDRIGLDIIRDIELHYAAESGDPGDLPPALLTERVDRGELGVKSGRGFYEYPDPAWQREDFLDPDGG